jgi:hypothetical protein
MEFVSSPSKTSLTLLVLVNDLFNYIIVFIIKGNADIRDVLEEKET